MTSRAGIRAANDDSARGATRTPSVEQFNGSQKIGTLTMSISETQTAPQADTVSQAETTGNAVWIAEFHRNELLKVDDNQSRDLTDERHLTLDKVHADYWGSGHGRTPEAEYANQVFSTAVFYMGQAVRTAADPAQALRALHVALGMTGLEG